MSSIVQSKLVIVDVKDTKAAHWSGGVVWLVPKQNRMGFA